MKGASLSWTHTFTQNNLVTGQEQNDSSNVPAAGDFKDSSGTPKNLTKDDATAAGTSAQAGNFSLVVPSGFTSPLKGATVYEQWMACEWSGNATSSVRDTGSTGTGSGLSPLNGATINTGANAGLVLASCSINVVNNSAMNIVVTGTNFTDTYSTSHDGTDSNNQADDAGSLAYNITSVASQTGLKNTWTYSGNATAHANAITSYNVSAGGGTTPVQTPMRTLMGAGV